MAPVRPDQASAVTIEFLRELYPLLRASNDFVIVDTPPGFSPEVIASIDSSTHICMVGMLDSLSLKNTKLGLETLELMGYKRDRIRLVLNRADTNVGVTQDDVSGDRRARARTCWSRATETWCAPSTRARRSCRPSLAPTRRWRSGSSPTLYLGHRGPCSRGACG